MPGNIPKIQRVSHAFTGLSTRCAGTAATLGLPLLLWRDQIADHPDWTARENHHRDFFSLYLTRHGRGVHVIDGRSFVVARGDVYVMAPGMAHHFTDVHQLVFDTVHFQAGILDERERQVLAATPGFAALFFAADWDSGAQREGRLLHLLPDAALRIGEIWDGVHREWATGTPEGALLARFGFLRLLVELSRERASSPRREPVPPARDSSAAAALRILEAEFTQPLRIARLADAVFLSPDRFTEVFKESVGRTPRDYLTHLRVRHAIGLLQSSDLPVERIAKESGFVDGPHLARMLRRETGLAPREIRRQFLDGVSSPGPTPNSGKVDGIPVRSGTADLG